MVAIIGSRQVGKTTLARQIASEFRSEVNWFDLENPEDLARLSEPKLTFDSLSGITIIDEIQRKTELFPLLTMSIDR